MNSSIILRLAQILIALPFLEGGWATLRHPHERAEKVARMKFPVPLLSVRANALLMVVAGMYLAIGVFPRYAALLLIFSLGLTTFFGHPFWIERGTQREHELRNFVKNLGVLGGLVLVALAG
jgi:putative oxidoreductase